MCEYGRNEYIFGKIVIKLHKMIAKQNPYPYFLAFGDQFDVLEGYENSKERFSCKNSAMPLFGYCFLVSMETVIDNQILTSNLKSAC